MCRVPRAGPARRSSTLRKSTLHESTSHRSTSHRARCTLHRARCTLHVARGTLHVTESPPMPPELLEFEEPIGVLLKEIEALSMLPQTPERQRSIDTLRRRAEEIRSELYASLTPWQRVLVA